MQIVDIDGLEKTESILPVMKQLRSISILISYISILYPQDI